MTNADVRKSVRICTPVDVLFAEHLLSSDAKLLSSKIALT